MKHQIAIASSHLTNITLEMRAACVQCSAENGSIWAIRCVFVSRWWAKNVCPLRRWALASALALAIGKAHNKQIICTVQIMITIIIISIANFLVCNLTRVSVFLVRLLACTCINHTAAAAAALVNLASIGYVCLHLRLHTCNCNGDGNGTDDSDGWLLAIFA